MEKYMERVGGIYEDIDYTKLLNRLTPALFIAKRIFFAVSVWFIKLELVAIFIEITMANLVLLLHAKPYLENHLYKTELLNEVIALLFFVSLQAFKANFLNPDEQYIAGWVSLGILLTFCTIHLSLNIIPMVSDCT